MASPIPKRVDLPDLSNLDDKLTANLALSMTVGKGFQPGQVQHLVTAYVRAVETALRCYERARLELVDATDGRKLAGFLRGCSSLEVAVMTLNRAMRLGQALRRSAGTIVGKGMLPSENAQYRLNEVRAAIEHNVDPILAGEAGVGLPLALDVTEDDLTINRGGDLMTITQVELGAWVEALHTLVVELTNHPERWEREAAANVAKRTGRPPRARRSR